MEESKEPEKPESKIPEEEEPSRTEEDREVQIFFFYFTWITFDVIREFNSQFVYYGKTNVDVSLYCANKLCTFYWWFCQSIQYKKTFQKLGLSHILSEMFF